MSTSITRFSKALLAMGAMLFCLSGITAQTHDVVITGGTVPGGGPFPVQIGAFGPDFCDPVTDVVSGEIAIATSPTDGNFEVCDSVAEDLSGKIALVDRGSCAFVDKARNAQEKGAIAMLLINVVDDVLFTMSGTAPDVTIPVFMIRTSDGGSQIRSAIGNGETVTVDIEKRQGEYPVRQIIWPANAADSLASEFNGGLNGWTTATLQCSPGLNATMQPDTLNLWEWDPLGDAPGGGCGGSTVFSPSKCNGAMRLESDRWDSDAPPTDGIGDGCGGASVATGLCPAPQIATLRSPWIDLDPNNGVAGYAVRFFQEMRQFNSTFELAYRTSATGPWTDTVAISINDNTEVNTSALESILTVPIPGTAGSDSLQIEFVYNANYYYWIIDDVQIVAQLANNLRVNNFFAIAPNAITPVGQEDVMHFLADIENVGADAQPNTVLNVAIEDDMGNVIYTGDNPYGTVEPNTLVENVNFPETYTHNAGAGDFTATYTIGSDNVDEDPTNNSRSFSYTYSDTTFAKENGVTGSITSAAGNWQPDDLRQMAFGNVYYVTNAQDANGNQLFATSVSFALGNAADAAAFDEPTIFLTLYKWVDEDPQDPATGSDAIDPDEREIVAQTFYTITGDEGEELITIPLRDFLTGEFAALEPNTYYALMLEHFNASDSDDQRLFWGTSDQFNYGAMVLASAQDGVRRYGEALGIAGNIEEEPYSTAGFNSGAVPAIRLHINRDPEVISVNNLPELTQEFKLYPNPTQGNLTVQFDLQEVSENTVLRVFDMAGKQLDEYRYQNVQRQIFNYDLSSLASGTYLMQLVTDRGTATKRFTVSK